MKRWLLSIIGGFVIPICYAAIISPVLATLQSRPDFHKILTWALAPLYLPVYISHLIDPDYPRLFVGPTSAFIVFAGDFLIYTLLTYGFLWLRSTRKPRLP